MPNPPLGSAEWEARAFLGRSATFVWISIAMTCGDECARTTEFEFSTPHTAGDSPESVTGTFEVQQYLPERFESTRIEIERVEIQDWGPEVYSGIVYPAPRGTTPTIPYAFWAESSGTAVE